MIFGSLIFFLLVFGSLQASLLCIVGLAGGGFVTVAVDLSDSSHVTGDK